jgi:hypothetical protein
VDARRKVEHDVLGTTRSPLRKARPVPKLSLIRRGVLRVLGGVLSRVPLGLAMDFKRVGQLAGADEPGDRRALGEDAGVRVGRFDSLLGGDRAAQFFDQSANAQ